MKKNLNKRKSDNSNPVNKKQDKKTLTKVSASSQLPYWILGIAILFVLIIRIRLNDVPLERDEGEYAYAGQQILKGIPPFISIYHVKLPGIYAAYATIELLFGQSCSGIHTGLMIVNVLTLIVIFLIGKRLFNPLSGAIAAACFGYLTLSQTMFGFTANAEHFVLLPAMTGILLLLRGISLSNSKSSVETKTKFWNLPTLNFFLSGLLLGTAYTMKQHALLFILFSGFYFLYKFFTNKLLNFKNLILNGFVLLFGVGIPFASLCMYFSHLGLFEKFWWWTWVYPRTYATQIPWSEGKLNFMISFPGIFYSTWLLQILALLGLLAIIFKETWDKKIFIIGFFIFSLVAVSVAFYFYPHYFLLAMPALALLVAAGAEAVSSAFKKNKGSFLLKYGGLLVVAFFLSISLSHEKSYLFEKSSKEVATTTYPGQPFVAAQVYGKYIDENSKPDDKIAILGSEPEIYFYSKRRAATGFVYTYEMMKEHPHVHEFETQMISEIEAAKPKFIIYVNVGTSWFSVKINNIDTTIYHWGFQYINDNYQRIGIVSVNNGNEASYCWDTPQSPCNQNADNWMGIYKRKEELQKPNNQ